MSSVPPRASVAHPSIPYNSSTETPQLTKICQLLYRSFFVFGLTATDAADTLTVFFFFLMSFAAMLLRMSGDVVQSCSGEARFFVTLLTGTCRSNHKKTRNEVKHQKPEATRCCQIQSGSVGCISERQCHLLTVWTQLLTRVEHDNIITSGFLSVVHFQTFHLYTFTSDMTLALCELSTFYLLLPLITYLCLCVTTN